MLPELAALTNRQTSEFDRALLTASHFGFMPIAAPRVTRQDLELTKQCGSHPLYDAAEKAALIRTYIEGNLSSLPHPLTLIYKRTSRQVTSLNPGYGLHFIGTHSAIAEAALIRTVLSILAEEGRTNLALDINCIGDRESVVIYERELVNFIKKYGGDLPQDIRESLRQDIFNLFRLNTPEALRLRELAPSSINFLSSPSRTYFKETLEYLEALNIEFFLRPELVGERNHVSHTIFAIRDKEAPEEVLAVGYRYSRIGRLMGLRK